MRVPHVHHIHYARHAKRVRHAAPAVDAYSCIPESTLTVAGDPMTSFHAYAGRLSAPVFDWGTHRAAALPAATAMVVFHAISSQSGQRSAVINHSGA